MPDHAYPTVSGIAAGLAARLPAAGDLGGDVSLRRPKCFLHGHVHRMELVIAGHLLCQLAGSRILEHDEVPNQVEKAALVEHTLQDNLQLRQRRRSVGIAGDGPPGLEPFLAGAERTDARLYAIRDNERRVGVEERRDLRLIRLELLKGRPNGGVLVGRTLQLNDSKRQSVDEQHHIGPARVLTVRDRELVERQPIVVVGHVEVDETGLPTCNRTILSTILDGDAVHQQAVAQAITLEQCRRVDSQHLSIGVVERLVRQFRIETSQSDAQSLRQHHVAVRRITPLGTWHADCHVGCMQHAVAERREPGECRFLDVRLVEDRHRFVPLNRRAIAIGFSTKS